jgi:hypothetical protein
MGMMVVTMITNMISVVVVVLMTTTLTAYNRFANVPPDSTVTVVLCLATPYSQNYISKKTLNNLRINQ